MRREKIISRIAPACIRAMALCLCITGVVISRQLPASLSSNAQLPAVKKEQGEEANVSYQIRHVFPPSKKDRFTIAVVMLDPAHFNRADLKSVACRLNREFSHVTRLKAGFLDDENVARLFLSGAMEMPEFDKAQRGLYYLDRAKHQEYIQFSTKRGQRRNEVTLRLKCD